ncbi:MAG: hypothetical protein Q4F30_06315 [Akkermansia sp.]|nr:hypothetical protein [Akkermansia sp.]
MATILGTVGVFGFDSDQQGILLESQDIDYKPDSKIQRDYRGVKVGIIFYDDQTDISMKGYIPRENPTDIRVAQTLMLANQPPNYGLSDASTGTNVVTGIKIGLKNEDLATFEISSTIFAFKP